MAWPGQHLWICAAQLHQVCIEVLPHPREGGWHLNAVPRECLHAFHHYQLYDGLASIGSRYHDGLRCLTFAVCHVHGADPTRHHGHCQQWRNQKWRCPTTIEGINGWCNHTHPVQSGYTGATGPLPRSLHMGTDGGQAKEEPKYFPCPWDHLWHPFLHRWQHHPHSLGTASQESRHAICLPTHRQTQRSRGTEDCHGGPSRHREEWASWKAQGMVLPTWSLTPSPVAPAGLRDFPLPGWNYPTAHQQVPLQVVGCAPCFSTVGLYTATGMLQLPFSSITEEFKVGKARLHLMLRDSPDEVIRQVQPEVRTGTKWSAAKVVQEAEASLQIKEVIGATQTGRAGLGSTPHLWFSREDSRGRRDMVITELKMIEEEKRVATAAGQAKQCAWMNWEEAEARKLSWSSLMTMEPLALSFLLRSTYNLLPTPANHKQWGFTGDDTCAMCMSARGTLWHILSSCGSSPQMYTWSHNRVLAILAEIAETQCRVANEQPTQDPKPCISFLQEGEASPRQVSKPQGQKFLAAAGDWKMAADLKEVLHFPHHIVHTQERPNIVIWSDTVIVELTVPWEENMKEAFERKKLRYENLRMECEDKGWACQVMPIEVGCRGFIGRTTTSSLTRLGLTNRARRRATQQLQTAAERASSWMWSKVRKSTTVWQNRPPSSLLPYPHHTPPQPHPSPTLSLPPPPPPSLSPRVHTEHPVALAPPSDITRWLCAAGGAKLWGTSGSRWNHLTRSGRWLTRVMSRQLLLHVVCIYTTMRKSRGPDMDPCGTPEGTDIFWEWTSLNETNWVLLYK